jgi:hypothetical protein
VDGFSYYQHNNRFALAELARGTHHFKAITVNGTIESPGQVQWDGKYLTVGDLERNVVDRIAVTGTQGNIEATVDFNNVQLAGSWIHGNKIVDPEPGDANVLFFDYAKGGTSTRTITDGIDGPLSVTVSSVPK